MRLLKKTSLISLLIILATSLSVSAESVQVNGGTLSMTNNPITFNSVTLDLAQNQTTTASSDVTVIDNSGSGSGWSVTLSASNFESSQIQDPSSGGSGTMVVSFPSSTTSVSASHKSTTGQPVDPTSGPSGNSRALSNSAQSIISASPGYGMGSYVFGLDLTINIPKVVSVKSLTGTGSDYSVSEQIGVVATNYTSIFTFTATAGI